MLYGHIYMAKANTGKIFSVKLKSGCGQTSPGGSFHFTPFATTSV